MSVAVNRSAAKVWNNGDEDYKELFRDEMITIPGRNKGEGNNYKYFEDYFSGVKFLGQYVDSKQDNNGKYLKCKPLSIEKIPMGQAVASTVYVSHSDGKTFKTQEALNNHLKTVDGTKFDNEDKEFYLKTLANYSLR